MTPVRIGDATLYCGDCLDILPTMGQVDLVLTDPPFGVGNFVQTTGRKMGRGKSRGVAVEWNESPPPPEFFFLVKSISRHRIIWGANFFNCFEDMGGAIVWDKCQQMPNFSKADIASCTHYQKTEIVRLPWTNFTATHQAETDHPCERPVALYEWCIRYLPGDIRSVLDPFLGSGSCGVAAMRLGRAFIGIERDPRYFDAACKRIEAAYAQGRLFTEPEAAPEQASLLGDAA